jgi:seryl-tRNA(Sec) selenium transferase
LLIRNDYTLRQAVAKLVEIGGEAATTHSDLERAIGPGTAAVVPIAAQSDLD